MASTFHQLLVVSCFTLALTRSELSGFKEPHDHPLEELPQQPASAGKVVSSRATVPEKVIRHLRPLERPSSPWEQRPFERPKAQVSLLRPMVRPEPVGQLRPMFRPDVPMERSRARLNPGSAMAEPQPQAQGMSEVSPAQGMIPQAPKPGQCPVTVCQGEFANIGKMDCMSDAQCPGAEKCCMDPCRPRRVCTQAGLHVHPGFCPLQESCISDNYVYKVVCHDDIQCSSETKCCYDQCTSLYVCKSIREQWPPAPPQPPGPIWPPIDPVWPPGPSNPGWVLPPGPDPSRPDKCSYYCPGSVRCCDHLMRPGYCPSSALCYTPQEEMSLTPSLKFCEADFECSRTGKCCFDQCRRQMVCRQMVYDPKVHPGQCPVPAPRCEQQELVEEKTPCTDDRSCSLHERCCSSPCYRTLVCMAGLNGIPGPYTTPPQPPGPDPSECDTFCPGTKRCCDGVEKNGFCPAPGKCRGALINSPKSCAIDYDCDAGDKCCQDSCSTLKVCRTAVASPTVHPGICPAHPSSCAQPLSAQHLASQPQPNECSQDMECTMEQRCCLDPCKSRKSCQYTNPPQPPQPPEPPQPPAPQPCKVFCPGSKVCCDEGEKEGFCPAPALCVGILLNPPPRCLQDYDCSYTSKCCFDDCQKQNYCRPAVPHRAVHPGSCPTAPPTCVGYSSQNKKACVVDSDCRFEQRCCYDGCLHRLTCLQAVADSGTPGPDPPAPAPPTCSVYCPGTKECCDNKNKEGFCPATSVCGGALLNPPPRCSSDYQCGGTDKCCFDGCERGKVCRPAMQSSEAHPGQCPAQQVCPSTNIKPQTQCAFDAGCRYEQKCCYDACNRHQICKASASSSSPVIPGCAIPCPHDASLCCDTKMKAGYCPWPSDCQLLSTNIGLLNPPTMCHGPDYSCPGTEKCCYDNCQRTSVCSPSVSNPYDHLGQCPAAQASCFAYKPTNARECGNDSFCSSNEKCCADACEQKKICKRVYGSAETSVARARTLQ